MPLRREEEEVKHSLFCSIPKILKVVECIQSQEICFPLFVSFCGHEAKFGMLWIFDFSLRQGWLHQVCFAWMETDCFQHELLEFTLFTFKVILQTPLSILMALTHFQTSACRAVQIYIPFSIVFQKYTDVCCLQMSLVVLPVVTVADFQHCT